MSPIGPIVPIGLGTHLGAIAIPSHRYTGKLGVYRRRYTDILEAYRHPTGTQESCRYAGSLQA